MQWMVMDDLMVCVTSSGEPDKAAVTSFLAELQTKPIRRIVATPMSTSDELSAERFACGEICVSRGIKVAILVEASVASDYASVAAMTQSNVATFSVEEIDAALAHLDVRGQAAAQVREAFAAMCGAEAAIAA
jgi:hypothetical protein